jgi:predicted ATPase
MEVAAAQADRFEDGVWLVKLASLSDPTLVAPEVASALRIGEQPGRTWVEDVL